MGEIEAAEEGALPRLVEEADLRGVLHVHTSASDGRADLAAMVEGARARGFRYLGVSDHSVSAHYANGLDTRRLREQAREIASLQRSVRGLRILHGVESDILEDGALDYDDEVLAELDFVIASVHSNFGIDRERMTERVLTAIRHPAVSVLGHPTGRLLLAREPFALDLERVLLEAARLGVAVELNANPQRLDLDWRHGRALAEAGGVISIGPDAHRVEGLDHTCLGVGIARKAWLEPRHVLNCRELRSLQAFLRKRRRGWTPRRGKRTRYGPNGEVLA
jgi:DNA polymerase (family 10)